MAGCCCNESEIASQGLQARQKRMLWLVLAINAVMFVTEFTAGLIAGSTALLGDSLDMLGDTMVYALSLCVLAWSARWKALSAGVKGTVMLGFGALVLAEAAYKAYAGTVPVSGAMMSVGAVALVANIVCLILLTRHREDDVNMRSAWICSRNDLFANSGVIIAGVLVWLTASVWPDVLVGSVIAVLFMSSGWGVLGEARQRYRQAGGQTAGSTTSQGVSS
tara:strand:+ start:317 stop:979 length:663 start_codon:yes stop_codon:yes gene_type:complete